MMCHRMIGPFHCCSVVHGDCSDYLSKIPDGTVPLLITDPPYGVRFVSGNRQTKYAPILGDTKFPTDLVSRAIAKSSHAAYVFCTWKNLLQGELPKPANVIAWVKDNSGMGNLEHHHAPQWEAICFYPGPYHVFIKRSSDVIYAGRTGNNFHPTQKPVDLIRRLIENNVGDVVLDPFAGSGTMCLAAKQCGRHFLGFELDKNHYQTALLRLGNAV